MNTRAATTIIFVGFFFLGMVFILWGIILPDLIRDLGLSELAAGTLFTLFSMGMIAGAILGGKYVRNFDFLTLFSVLTLIDGVLLLLISSVTWWPYLMVLMAVLGVFSSCMVTIGHTLIAQMYEQRRFAMMGLMDFMFSSGTLAAPLYISLLYFFDFDWRWATRFLAGYAVLLSLYTYLVARADTRARKQANVVKEKSASLSYTSVLKQPVFLLLALSGFGYGAVEFGTANWFVSYAQNGHGFDGDTARYVFAFFTAGMVLSRLCFAFFLRWLTVHRLAVVLASMTLCGALLIKLMHNPVAMGAGNFVLGLGLGGLFPLILSAAMNIDADKGPVLSGVCVIGNSVGVQVASFGTGLWAQFAPLQIAFWVIPIAAVWLWVMTWLYSRKIKARSGLL